MTEMFTRSARWRPPELLPPKRKGPDHKKSPARYMDQCTGNNTNLRLRPPAYGRELLHLRESGRVPDGVVIVAVGLWSLRDQVPAYHSLVIPDDLAITRFDLRLLAGLSVCIVHDERRQDRACDLVNPIIAANPLWLAIANIERGTAATVLENGAIGMWPWDAWQWDRFDGDQPLELPNTKQVSSLWEAA